MEDFGGSGLGASGLTVGKMLPSGRVISPETLVFSSALILAIREKLCDYNGTG